MIILITTGATRILTKCLNKILEAIKRKNTKQFTTKIPIVGILHIICKVVQSKT